LGELELDDSGLLDEFVPPDASPLDSIRFDSELFDEPAPAFDSAALDSAFDSLFPPASPDDSPFPPPSPDDSLDAFSVGFPAPPFRCAFRP
jgi:hypothetical protein